MAFDNVFAGPPTTGAPGTIKSPSLGVDVTNNNLYISSGQGWQEVSASGGGITQLTGDILAGPGSGSKAATLPVVNSNVGAFSLATVTANAKGQVTAVAAGTLPVGSSSTAGIVKVDGTTITATAGVISAVGGSSFPAPTTKIVTGVTEIDFTSILGTAFANYDIILSNLKINTGTGILPVLQFSTDNGSTYDTGSNYSQGRSYTKSGSSTAGGSGATGTGFSLTGDPSVTDSGGSYVSGKIHIFSPDSAATTKQITFELQFYSAANSAQFAWSGGGFWNNSAAVTALRLIMDGTATFTGQVTLQPLPQ